MSAQKGVRWAFWALIVLPLSLVSTIVGLIIAGRRD